MIRMQPKSGQRKCLGPGGGDHGTFLGAGGVVLPNEGLLKRIREVTQAHGVLLIFDEIFSFRVNIGGCQNLYGITPDLTTVGKVVGGACPSECWGQGRVHEHLLS